MTLRSDREKIPMLAAKEILDVLSKQHRDGMTATNIFFAARPELADVRPRINAASYSTRILKVMTEEGQLTADATIPHRVLYRCAAAPQDKATSGRRDLREISHGGAPSLEASLDTPAVPLSEQVAATPVPRITPGSVGEIFQYMLQRPKAGSAMDVVTAQAGEGIDWLRAAGHDDVGIAQIIIDEAGLDEPLNVIASLVSGVPSRSAATRSA